MVKRPHGRTYMAQICGLCFLSSLGFGDSKASLHIYTWDLLYFHEFFSDKYTFMNFSWFDVLNQGFDMCM